MGMQLKLLIKDFLMHDKYNWPLTKLSYPVFLEKPVREGRWNLYDEQGISVPLQITDVKKDGKFIKSLNLHFMAKLGKGESKEFCFVANDGMEIPEERRFFHSAFHVKVEEEKNKFVVTYRDKRMVCVLPFKAMEFHIVYSGAVFEESKITCAGARGEKYELNIRRIDEMPFWELQEKMSGFKENPNGKTPEMQIIFENFNFTHRYSAFRPIEKIDAYLDEHGNMPVTVMPYENYISWRQSKYIAFLGEESSAGVFIRDNLGWDDGKYPIWGSNKEFGISFNFDGRNVTARFPLRNGKRFIGIAAYEGADQFYVKNLWKWYALLHLDKVKDWVLGWEEDQGQYPKFFKKEQGKPMIANGWHYRAGEMLDGTKMTEVIDRLSCSVNGEMDVEDTGMDPVRNREFGCWTVIVDLTADEMTKEEFDRAKAFFAFMAYLCMDENYMPTKNMLAGHPNFLADTAAVAGFFSALFPMHPKNKEFREYFHKTVKGNLRYHIRPDVAAYESLGGRETENLSGYSFAMLRPYIHVCELYALCGYSIPLVCENGARWLNWITNCMSAPVNGRRLMPTQGAHARTSDIPYSLYEFARLLEKEYPEIAENTYAVCEGSPLHSFGFDRADDDVFRTLFQKESRQGTLRLKSEKFTGYGCILREAVGTKDEISVHIQQLDRGPHYRWGCFENTGNGGIHYFAAGKRYSFNTAEGTGDWNIGAEESNCGFAVLIGHTYYNIGFQDLTEPLRDFPLIKQIKLIADDKIHKFYKYKRVSLAGKDYVIIFDAVSDMRTRGRFTWSVGEGEEFPEIYQLKPGAEKETVPNAKPVNLINYIPLQPGKNVKMVGYDGYGNFLSVVSHRKDLRVKGTDFGGMAYLPDRTDYIFEDDAKVRYRENGVHFIGKSGIISIYNNGTVKGALTEGQQIGVKDLLIIMKGNGAVFFEEKGKGWGGKLIADIQTDIIINGRKFSLEKGKYKWEAGTEIVLERIPERQYGGTNGFIRDTRSHEFGFDGFNFNRQGEILTYPEEG